jgi:predicted choloylglycine hydrolase
LLTIKKIKTEIRLMKRLETEFRSKEHSDAYAIWRTSKNQPYLEIDAEDPFDRGFLQARALEKKIRALKRILHLLALINIFKGYSYKKFIQMAQNYLPFIPNYILEELKGMASCLKGITFDDILLQNCFLDIIYGQVNPKNAYPNFNGLGDVGCTSFGAINHNGIPIIGQNFDYPLLFRSVLSFTYLKQPKLANIFSLRLGGALSLPCGINSYGFALTINAIRCNVKSTYEIPTSIKTRIGFSQCKTVEEGYRYSYSSPPTVPYNLMISDREKIIAIENAAAEHHRIDVKDVVVQSNTFTAEKMQKYLVKKKYSKHRQRYAETQLRKLHNNSSLSNKQLISLLCDFPIIKRVKPFRSISLCSFTKKSFRLGLPKIEGFGDNPIYKKSI